MRRREKADASGFLAAQARLNLRPGSRVSPESATGSLTVNIESTASFPPLVPRPTPALPAAVSLADGRLACGTHLPLVQIHTHFSIRRKQRDIRLTGSNKILKIDTAN